MSNFDTGKRGSLRTVLDVTATLAMLIAATVLIWRNVRAPDLGAAGGSVPVAVPSEPISLSSRPSLGSSSAPIVIVVFSDFECPYCRNFAADTLPVLRRQYVEASTLQLSFRHLPLATHEHAERLAQASVCADRQDRFWPFHDLLFARLGGPAPDDDGLEGLSAQVGADVDAFRGCLQDPITRQVVAEDLAMARQLGLSGTPSFLIGRRLSDGLMQATQVLVGALPAARFAEAIEAAR